MAKLSLPLLMLALAAACTFAQPDPDNPPPPDPGFQGPPATQMLEVIMQQIASVAQVTVPTDNGVFVVRGGVVARFDAATMEPKGTVDLFGPLLEWPKDGKFRNDDEKEAALLERGRRIVPPAVTAVGKDLLILIGAYYFRVDGETLHVKVATRLPGVDPLYSMIRLAHGEPEGSFDILSLLFPVKLEVRDNQVCVARKETLTVVRADTGALVKQQTLPAALTRALIPSRANDPRAGRRNVMEPEEAKTLVVIGTVQHHEDVAGGIATVKDEAGKEYVLQGEQGIKLSVQTKGDGALVAVIGTYRKQIPGMPAFGAGYLEARACALLPVAEVN